VAKKGEGVDKVESGVRGISMGMGSLSSVVWDCVAKYEEGWLSGMGG
jgi:hypothetical protein